LIALSEELIRAGEIRERLAGYQVAYPNGLPNGLAGNTIQQIGLLATLDPSSGLMVAENIVDDSARINALAKVGSNFEEVEPIIDAWGIALSEAIDPDLRSRKLEFIAMSALDLTQTVQHDTDLPREIARDIEKPIAKGRVLLAIASRTRDPELLEQVDFLSASKKLGNGFDAGLMHEAQTLHYRVGINASERMIERKLLGNAPYYYGHRKYKEEDAQGDRSRYVAGCVYDAYEREDYTRLLPVADEVAEAFSRYAAEKAKSRTWDSLPFEGFRTNDFKPMVEAARLAEVFLEDEPEATRKLLRATRQLINTKIKTIPRLIADKKERDSRTDEFHRAIDDIGLLDQDEIARELGLLGALGDVVLLDQEKIARELSLDADLAALEAIGREDQEPPTA